MCFTLRCSPVWCVLAMLIPSSNNLSCSSFSGICMLSPTYSHKSCMINILLEGTLITTHLKGSIHLGFCAFCFLLLLTTARAGVFSILDWDLSSSHSLNCIVMNDWLLNHPRGARQSTHTFIRPRSPPVSMQTYISCEQICSRMALSFRRPFMQWGSSVMLKSLTSS